MLRNHRPKDANKNMYPLKTQNTASPSYHLPQTQQLHHTETLYIPGYITQRAVLRIMKETHLVPTFQPLSKFSHVIWSFLVLYHHSYPWLVPFASHTGKAPWTWWCPQTTKIHWKTQNTASLFYHLPQAQLLYHTEPLYLPGYTTTGAVITIIKETHNIKLTVHKYFFWNGMVQGSTRSNWMNKSFIDIRSNERNIKTVHKHGTADCKPDVLKTSSLYCNT